jgi:hypothetical protein
MVCLRFLHSRGERSCPCGPLPAGSACTHRVPAGSGPVGSRTPAALRSGGGDRVDRPPRGQGHEGCLKPKTDDIPRRRRVLVLDVTQAASEVSHLIHEARDLNLPVEPGVRDGRNALVRWAVLLQEVLP